MTWSWGEEMSRNYQRYRQEADRATTTMPSWEGFAFGKMPVTASRVPCPRRPRQWHRPDRNKGERQTATRTKDWIDSVTVRAAPSSPGLVPRLSLGTGGSSGVVLAGEFLQHPGAD